MFDRHALEEALSAQGLAPRYRTTVPHSLARDLATGGELLMREPPYPSTQSTFRAVWHSRNDHDPAHVWLQDSITRAANEVA